MGIKTKIIEKLEPLKQDLFNVIYCYNGTLESCGYSAWIVNSLLREALPEFTVKLGFGFKDGYMNQTHHFWTEVLDKNEIVNVDLTLGQFNPEFKDKIVISEDLAVDLDYILSRNKKNFPKELAIKNMPKKYIFDAIRRNEKIRQCNFTAKYILKHPNIEATPGIILGFNKTKQAEFTENAIKELKKKMRNENLNFSLENVLDKISFAKIINDDTSFLNPANKQQQDINDVISFFSNYSLTLPVNWK